MSALTIVAALGVTGLVACSRTEGARPTHEVTVQVLLEANESEGGCSAPGAKRFAGKWEGAEVRISDGDGRILGDAPLDGPVESLQTPAGRGCVLTTTVESRDSDVYGIVVQSSESTGVRVTRADLEAAGWTVILQPEG